MGVPYLPVVGLAGSDLVKRRDDMRMAPDPFGGGFETIVVQALRPDVALFHGLRADRAGNVHFGYPSDNTLIAEASRRVIVTVEEVVETLDGADRAGDFLPGILVDAVVPARYGAHPAACPGAYPVDGDHMIQYAESAASDEQFKDYLRRTVYDPGGHPAYVERFVPDGWGQAGQLPLREAGD